MVGAGISKKNFLSNVPKLTVACGKDPWFLLGMACRVNDETESLFWISHYTSTTLCMALQTRHAQMAVGWGGFRSFPFFFFQPPHLAWCKLL